MRYLIDVNHQPPVVVLQLRNATDGDITAQRYADQTGHVLVWASGPDAVTEKDGPDVVHPTAHKPTPLAPPPATQGVNLAPPRASSTATDLSQLWSWVKGEVESLEKPAEDLGKKILAELLSKLLQ